MDIAHEAAAHQGIGEVGDERCEMTAATERKRRVVKRSAAQAEARDPFHEERDPLERLLLNWARWMRTGELVRLSFAQLRLVDSHVGDGDGDENDRWQAAATDAAINDLPASQRCAIHHAYLNAVFRFGRVDTREWCATLGSIEAKGRDFGLFRAVGETWAAFQARVEQAMRDDRERHFHGILSEAKVKLRVGLKARNVWID